MLKLLGSLCIFLAGGTVWRMRLQSLRRELSLLRDFMEALEEMASGIRLERTPMPRLLRRAAQGRGREAAAFFQAVERSVAAGTELPQAWRTAAGALALPEQPREALVELGRKLTGDEEEACKGIQLACNSLARCFEEQKRQQPDMEKRSTALCFSAAALLVILLI